MLDEHAGDLTGEQRKAILSDNAAALYGVDAAALVA